MYLYFSNERKLQTMIAHGSPIRQGDSFGLYVWLDLDFFDGSEENGLYNDRGQEILYCYYKTPSMTSFSSTPINLINQGTKIFEKNSYDEVTYKLKDGEKYHVFYSNIDTINGLTQDFGDLQLVFSFLQLTPTQATNAINFTAKLYVEPTFGKNRPQIDSTINQTNYDYIIGKLNDLFNTKNIALEQLKSPSNAEDPFEYPSGLTTIEQKLAARANSVYSQWNASRKGWIIISDKSENVDVRDMYILFDNGNMFVVSSETGIIYKYNGSTLSPLMYSINVFGENLVAALNRIGTNYTLADALDDFRERIEFLEDNTVFDVKYQNGAIQKSKVWDETNQRFTYQDVVTNTTLRQDLGINAIEQNVLYDTSYTRATNLGEANETPGSFTTQKGKDSSSQEITNTNELKTDMKLDLVDNKPSSDVLSVANKSNTIATIRAIVNALENGDSTNIPEYTKMKNTVEYIYQFLQIEGDSDDLVNKIEEIIAVLDTLPENSDIFATITNIFNKIGEGETDTYFYDPDPNLTEEQRQSRTIKGRIEYLYQNADKHIIVFIRYSDPGNRDLLTIPVANWTILSQPNTNYPDAEYYAVINPRTVENPDNPAFDNVIDMEIVFDKESEQEYIVGAEFDDVAKVLTIYANSLPNFAITIDTIKIISNVHHTMSLNVSETNQIADNTDRLDGHDTDIANINRDKQDKSNLVTNFTNADNTHYPSAKLTKDNLDLKQTIDNKITSFSSNVDDTHYPSAKLTKDNLDLKQDKSNLVTSWSATVSNSKYPSEELVKLSLDALDTGKQDKSNLVTNFTNADNTHYPSAKLTKDNLDLKQTIDNKITSFSSNVDDTHYPSAKLTKDNLDLKQTIANKINDFNSNVDNDHYPSALAIKNQLDLKQTIANKITSLSNNVDDTHYPSAKLVDDNYYRKNYSNPSDISIETNKIYKIDGKFKIELTSYHSGTGQYDPSGTNLKIVILSNCVFRITSIGTRVCQYQYIDGTTTHQTATSNVSIDWTSATASVEEISSETSNGIKFGYIGVLNKID